MLAQSPKLGRVLHTAKRVLFPGNDCFGSLVTRGTQQPKQSQCCDRAGQNSERENRRFASMRSCATTRMIIKPSLLLVPQRQQSDGNRRCFHCCHESQVDGSSELQSSSGNTTTGGEHLHIPVMVDEVLKTLQPKDGQTLVDMTFGAGGHTRSILQAAPGAEVFVLDRDPTAYALAQSLATNHLNVTPLLGKFSEAHHLLAAHGIMENSVDGIVFDVGASSMQFDQAQRGFALSQNGPLDMRMDGTSGSDQMTAADVVNHLDEAGLYKIIKCYGEEKLARLIARAIVDSRHAFGRITTTQQLAKIVGSVFEGTHRRDKLMRQSHVATKTFQALRIFVNNELNELYNGLLIAHYLLRPGGICAVITFHSLEDRVAKRHFHGIDMDAKLSMSIKAQHRNSARTYSKQEVLRLMQQKWQPIWKGVLESERKDVLANPRARSAKMRAAIKLET